MLSAFRAGFRSWLALSPRRHGLQKGPRRVQSVKPNLEQLEDRITPSGPTLTTLASFNCSNGATPYGTLVVDGNGNLFGTTFKGGTFNDGTVFELAHGSGTITTLANFDGTNGANPDAGLVMDSSGNLYGTTVNGGASALGTVFEVAQGSGTITTLASFPGTYADGANPQADLALDGSSNLYGTTVNGGQWYAGTVFEVAKGSGTITTLADFAPLDSQGGKAGLILDSSGNLYGTAKPKTPGYFSGIVFEVAKGSGTISPVGLDRKMGYPDAGLLLDSAGNLYGTSADQVFELASPRTGNPTWLATFNGTNGASPCSALIMDRFGNLYGATEGGVINNVTIDATVFEVAKGSGTITTLATFSHPSGTDSQNGLVLDSAGNMYGTTPFDGPNGDGTVYELQGTDAQPDQWTGANAAVDTNWSDGANWSEGRPPNSGEAVWFTNNSSVQAFTSTVDPGFASSVGNLYIDSTWGGTINVNSPLVVTGSFSLASGSFGGPAAVAIAGKGSSWTGGQIDLGTGGFTNRGTLSADTTGGNLVLTGAGTLTNNGTLKEAGTNSLVLENGATLSNAAGATFDLTDNGSVSQLGSGTLVNAGQVKKTMGNGTSYINCTTLNNTGTVAVSSGTLNIGATVSQLSGSTLTAGSWLVTSTAKVPATLVISPYQSIHVATIGSKAQVTLSGPNATFTNLASLDSVLAGGSLTLARSASFTTAGALVDDGGLTLSPASILTVSGSFTQSSTGTLTVGLSGTSSKPLFGQLVTTTGTVSLGGSLKVNSSPVPAVGSSFAILDNEAGSAIAGMFATLAEGATFKVKVGGTTMIFQISYRLSDDDSGNNVVLTRIS
jgi:uncharacterized repeat protein (TIGR03803 family)